MKYLCLTTSALALLLSIFAVSRNEANVGMHGSLVFMLDQASRNEIKSITGAEAFPFSFALTSSGWEVSYKIDEYNKDGLTELALKNSLSSCIELYLRHVVKLDASVELLSYRSEENEVTLKFELLRAEL